MPLTVRLGADSAGIEPSPAIWSRFINADTMWHRKANILFDDFTAWQDLVATNVGSVQSESGGWTTYEDTSGTILNVVASHGILKFITAATNNNEVWAQPGGVATAPFVVNKITNSTPMMPLAFECRVAFGQATTTHNWFLGLSEEALAAADTQADSGGAMASKDFIGFNVSEADGTVVDLVYRTAGQAQTTWKAAIATITANTYVKLGFVFDPWETNVSQRAKCYLNGVDQGSFLTDTNIAAATFPSAQQLGVLLGGKNNNSNVNMSVDWVRVMQFKEAY